MAIANISLFICQHDKLDEFPFSMANVEVEVVQTDNSMAVWTR